MFPQVARHFCFEQVTFLWVPFEVRSPQSVKHLFQSREFFRYRKQLNFLSTLGAFRSEARSVTLSIKRSKVAGALHKPKGMIFQV